MEPRKKVARESFDALIANRPDSIDEDTARSVLEAQFNSSGYDIEHRYKHEIDAEGAADWAKQNPKTSALESMGNSFPIKQINEGMGAVSNGINYMGSMTPERTKGPDAFVAKQVMKLGGWIREQGRKAEDVSDEYLVKGGNRTLGQAGRLVGIIAQNSPIPESPGEAALAAGMSMLGNLAPKKALGKAKLGAEYLDDSSGSSAAERGLRQPFGQKTLGLGAAKVFDDAKGRASFFARVKSFGDEMINLTEKVKQNNIVQRNIEDGILRPTPELPDFSKYGDSVAVDLHTKTNFDKAPLAARAVALREYAKEHTTKEAPILVVEGAKELRGEIEGVIKDSADTKVKAALQSYIDLEYSPEDKAYAAEHGMKATARAKTISDLIEDRGTLGKLYVNLKEKFKDTPQSRAVLRLQDYVDQEISRRINASEQANVSAYQDEVAAREFQGLGVRQEGVPGPLGSMEKAGSTIAKAERGTAYDNLNKAKNELSEYQRSLGDSPELVDPRYERNLDKLRGKVKQAQEAAKAAKVEDLEAKNSAGSKPQAGTTGESLPQESQAPMEPPRTGLVKDFEQLRSEWKQFYETQYSDAANDIRAAKWSQVVDTVFKTQESVMEAQAALTPEAFEGLKAVKTRLLVEELRASKNPVKMLMKQKPGYWESVYGPQASEALMGYAESIAETKILERKLTVAIREQPDMVSGRVGDKLSEEWSKRPGDKNSKAMTNLIRFGGISSIPSAVWLYGAHPWVAAGVATLGIASLTPELLARAYLKAGPTMRSAIKGLSVERPGLGKLGGMSNLASVQAFVTASMVEDSKKQESQVTAPKSAWPMK